MRIILHDIRPSPGPKYFLKYRRALKNSQQQRHDVTINQKTGSTFQQAIMSDRSIALRG